MTHTQPTQAMSTDHDGSNDGVEAPGGKSGSESSGGAYPNPHTGKDGKDDVGGGFLGHGGQSEMNYSGTGDGHTDADVGNENAVTK